MAKLPKGELQMLDIKAVETRELTFHILGNSPLILNRFSFKARQQLLLPPIPTNRAERNTTLKHDPEEEFRSAVYLNRDAKRPALFHLPNGMFHKSLGAAALDIPGAKRTQIERLTKITDVNIDLFGVPRLFMAMVRNSDINKTPDVRTRPILEEWACKVTVLYVAGTLTERTIAHLLDAAGQIIGIGDWRGEKGGPFGSYRVVNEENVDWKRIVKTQARAAQEKAMATPVCFDADSEELLAWFHNEVAKRERTQQLAGSGKKGTERRGRGKPKLEILSPITGKAKALKPNGRRHAA